VLSKRGFIMLYLFKCKSSLTLVAELRDIAIGKLRYLWNDYLRRPES